MELKKKRRYYCHYGNGGTRFAYNYDGLVDLLEEYAFNDLENEMEDEGIYEMICETAYQLEREEINTCWSVGNTTVYIDEFMSAL